MQMVLSLQLSARLPSLAVLHTISILLAAQVISKASQFRGSLPFCSAFNGTHRFSQSAAPQGPRMIWISICSMPRRPKCLPAAHLIMSGGCSGASRRAKQWGGSGYYEPHDRKTLRCGPRIAKIRLLWSAAINDFDTQSSTSLGTQMLWVLKRWGRLDILTRRRLAFPLRSWRLFLHLGRLRVYSTRLVTALRHPIFAPTNRRS